MLRKVGFVLLARLLVACSPPSGTLKVVVGAESDALTRKPAPTRLTLDAYDSSCNKTTLATVSLPAANIDLGDIDENQVATLVVTGTDDSGTTLVRGQSLPISFGTFESSSLPIFLQRTGEWARLPGPLPDGRSSPLLSLVQAEYLFVGGGAPASLASTTQFYDFVQLAPSPMAPSLTIDASPGGSKPFVPVSAAFAGPIALLIDAAGNGEYFDFTGVQPGTVVTPPDDAKFSDVAGGQTIYGDDGNGHLVDYIVGGTRTTGAPTKWVLVIDTNDTSRQEYVTGNLVWAQLGAWRLGAAAAWAPGHGLVVAGGSAGAAGVEVIPVSGRMGNALAYPEDATAGAGASLLDDHDVLLAGGLDPSGSGAPTRSIDLSCTATSCTPAAWSPLPVALSGAQSFVLSPFCAGASAPTPALVVGEDAAGDTRAFRVAMLGSATELPTKVPHKGAAASLSPIGSVAVFGGADAIEAYMPPVDP